jgi:hypothetical protein
MSDFFDPPPAPDPEPEPARPELPPWRGAPRGVLPGVVPVEIVLARSPRAAVCITRLAAYPTGFEFQVVVMAAAGEDDDEVDPMLFGHSSVGHRRHRNSEVEAERLRLGVQFADGAKTTNTGWGSAHGFEHEPLGPVMQPGGGGGGGGSWHQELWVWPLPPRGPLTFVCEWEHAGIALARHELDGALLIDAAGRAQRVFEDDQLSDAAGFTASTIAFGSTAEASGSAESRPAQ